MYIKHAGLIVCLIVVYPFFPFAAFFPMHSDGDSPKQVDRGKADLSEIIKSIEAEYKNRKERDIDRILSGFEYLGDAFPDASPSEQSAIIKTLKKAFRYHPTIADKAFQIKAAEVLSRTGKEGLKSLLTSLESKQLEPREKSDLNDVLACQEVQSAIIEAVGSFADRKSAKRLFKLLWSSENRIIAATANALSRYSEEELRYRKPIVEELIKRLSGLQRDQYPETPPGMDRRPKPGVDRQPAMKAVNEALRKLTGKGHWGHSDWENWFRENKDKDEWDSGSDRVQSVE